MVGKEIIKGSILIDDNGKIAKQTDIADRVGSLEKGKDTDIVIWTADPMTNIGAHTYITFGGQRNCL